MKKITLLIYILIFPLYTFSQNYFQINIGTDTSTVVLGKSIETNDNKFILAGFKYLDSIGRAYLIKLSETGEIIKEEETSVKDSILFISDIIKTENNKFITCTFLWKDSTATEIRTLIFNEYDYELNVTGEFRVQFPTDTLFIDDEMTDIRKKGDEFICFGNCRSEENKTSYNYILKITDTGEVIDFKLYPGNMDIYDIELSVNNHLFMSGMGIDDIYMTISKLNYSDLSTDSTFDTADIPGIPNMGILLLEKTYLEFITDSTFIFSAIDLQPQMNVTVLDTSFNVLHNTSFGFDYQEFPAKREGLSVLNEDEIFIANWDLFTGYCLTKIDSELNIYWEKFFVVEQTFGLYSITATEDGGCLIIGTKGNNGKKNTVVIKTDSNGNISGIEDETLKLKARELILYPNPGNEQLNIRTAVQRLGGEFTMYDITGKLIFQQKITESITEINTQHLPSGTYIFNYTHKGKEIESGKWVKQ